MPQAVTWGAFFVCYLCSQRKRKFGGEKPLWKLTELWKNQKTVFPQLLEPSVHSSHNAGCCWSFLKHNFSSTPPAAAAFDPGRSLSADLDSELGESRSAATAVAPAPDGAGAHPVDEPVASGSARLRAERIATPFS